MIVEAVMLFLSDLTNLLYFFTDHYTLLFIVGLLTNKEYEYTADYWGTVMWIASNLFLIAKDLIQMYRLRQEKGKSEVK